MSLCWSWFSSFARLIAGQMTKWYAELAAMTHHCCICKWILIGRDLSKICKKLFYHHCHWQRIQSNHPHEFKNHFPSNNEIWSFIKFCSSLFKSNYGSVRILWTRFPWPYWTFAVDSPLFVLYEFFVHRLQSAHNGYLDIYNYTWLQIICLLIQPLPRCDAWYGPQILYFFSKVTVYL